MIEDAVDGVAGILLLPAKIIILILGAAIEVVLNFFAEGDVGRLTVQKILFNKVPITDINFFDYNSAKDDSAVKVIRENVATWYIGIRNIAAVLLVIVAIYVGLRMAMSTVAEDKAKYKQMLIDWVTSLCLLFILHYIMVIVIQLNNTLVETIGSSLTDKGMNDVTEKFATQSSALASLSLSSLSFSKGVAQALAYFLLVLMTFIYLVSYIKRMITIGFLIIIAPLVTVTYSIDKMGDGKSQALNTWFKEFAYNILIQPFQCVTYLALCASALDLFDSNDLKSAVLAICMLIFLKTSEKIIKHIFNFRADSMADTFANAALLTTAVSGFTNLGKNIADGGNDSGQRPSEKLQSENRRERALPVNNSGDRGIRMHDSTASDAVAVGAGSAVIDSIDEERAYNRQEQDNSGSNNNSSNADRRERNSDNNSEKRKKKSSGVLAKAGRIVIGANTIFLGTALGAIAGAATGDFKATLSGGVSGYGLSKGIKARGMNAIINREIKNRTSSALFDYKNQRGDISDRQLIEEGMQLLDGTREARTDSERELRDSLMDMYDRRMKLGDDEEDGLVNTKKAMQEILDKNRMNQRGNEQNLGQNNRNAGNANTASQSQNSSTQQSQTQPTQRSTKPNRYTVPSNNSDSTESKTIISTQSRAEEVHNRANTETRESDNSPTPIQGEQSIKIADSKTPRSEEVITSDKKETESSLEGKKTGRKHESSNAEKKEGLREESTTKKTIEEHTDVKKDDNNQNRTI